VREAQLFGEELPARELSTRRIEMAAGGYTSLEKHRHTHAVMILRGQGTVIIGTEVFTIGPCDLVQVPPLTWHQFLASENEPLGFLCLVNCDRDRPVRPTEAEAASLRKLPRVGEVVQV
jgi:quercetin dioxygenase-like cupin family protein